MMKCISDIENKLPVLENTDYRIKCNLLFSKLNKTCIVIDDDPTGNQTVHNVPLLTDWSQELLEEEFKKKTPIFFLLTNSRSLTAKETQEVYIEIVENIKKASLKTGRGYSIISRSDSTLRGHFKTEVSTIQKIENKQNAITVFIPVMFEGGRVTAHDIHYIKEEDNLLPVSASPFAKDHTFGYQSSNLKDWIQEKTEGKVIASSIKSISLKELRSEAVERLADRINEIEKGTYLIANALDYRDLDKVSCAMLLAEKKGKEILYRTSSSFVPSYVGMPPKNLLKASEITNGATTIGGITIVGSYVPKSSSQLKNVLEDLENITQIEVEVSVVLTKDREQYLKTLVIAIDKSIASGKDVVIYTSRKLITGKSKKETIEIAFNISKALIYLIQQIKNRPKYILAKGGITSNDIAIKGLGMKRSITIGQILPGVSVWKMGEETRFPNIGYMVFPGNVGTKDSLKQLIKKLR